MTVNENGLNGLANNPNVKGVAEDQEVTANLSQTATLMGTDVAWGLGYSGAGQAIAILDTGVNSGHSFLSGKVVEEACYSYSNPSYGYETTCPSGAEVEEGAGSGTKGSSKGKTVTGDATKYFLSVRGDAGELVARWYTADELGCGLTGF